MARAGFDAIPAHTVREAQSLLELLRLRVDVLVANLRVRAAGSFVRRMRALNPELRVVELASAGKAARGRGSAGAGIRYLDPVFVPRMEAGDWRALVRD